MPSSSDSITVALVGAGPSALYILWHLLHRNEGSFRIVIFEQSTEPGAGMPYSIEWTDSNHYANISSEEIPRLPISFKQWLRKRSMVCMDKNNCFSSDVESNFIPKRVLIGEYFRNQFEFICNELKSRGSQIDLRMGTRIIDIEKDSSGKFLIVCQSIKDQQKYEYQSDKAIIATGHAWPTEKQNEYCKYNVFQSPWPISKIKSVTGSQIALIGGSLSAIDVCLAIAHQRGTFARNYNGNLVYKPINGSSHFSITMISRRGVLPSQRFYFENPKIKLHQYISKKEVYRLIKQNKGVLSLDKIFEISFINILKDRASDLHEIIKDMKVEKFVNYIYRQMSHESHIDLFQRNYEAYFYSIQNKRPIFWKEILDDFVYTLSFYARHLSIRDRIRLNQTLLPLLSHVVAFLPQVSCEAMIALLRAGHIVTKKGTYSDHCTVTKGGVELHLNNESSAQGPSFFYDVVVDCRGQKNIKFDDFPFKGLVKSGTVSPALLHWKQDDQYPENTETLEKIISGIAVNDKFNPISVAGAPDPNVWITALPLISGQYPYHSGLPFCNEVARIVARELGRSMRRS